MRNYFILIFLSLFLKTYSQPDGNTWLLGYNDFLPIPEGSKISLVETYFLKPPYPKLERNLKDLIDVSRSNASISLKPNEINLFYNGETLYNKNNKNIKGGDSINYNANSLKADDNNVRQSGIILPFPGKNNQFVLFHTQTEYYFPPGVSIAIGSMRVMMSVVDMNKDNGLGEVISKRKIIVEDTLGVGQLAACKHANGRDWWLIVIEDRNNGFYKFLLTPEGVKLHHRQYIGQHYNAGGGQALFSPDGKYYVTYDGEKGEVFDFDRCTGQLSHYRRLSQPDPDVWAAGGAISANSRYFYASIYTHIHQYDLWAQDIEASRVTIATWDGFKNNFGQTSHFNVAQLAPNGKIYVGCAGAIEYMHVINEPNKKGDSCQFVHRGLVLPSYNSWSVPNHPNYHLGTLKGSTCDTLGNVAVQEVKQEDDFKVFPNPANDILTIETIHSLPYEIVIKDVTGRIFYQNKATFNTQISVSEFMNGLYFCEFWQNNKRIAQQKIIIIH